MKENNLYILAVRVNDEELIANIQLGKILNPFHFTTLEEAKEMFSEDYKVLSGSPNDDIELFGQHFEKLALFRPAFVKLSLDTAVSILNGYKVDNQILEFKEISLLPTPLSYFKVKPGFIDKYLAVDILKDIESIPSVGPDGRIQINKFNVHVSPESDNPEDYLINEEDAKEILRKRGLL